METQVKDGVIRRTSKDAVETIAAQFEAAVKAKMEEHEAAIINQAAMKGVMKSPGGVRGKLNVDWTKVGFGEKPIEQIAKEVGCTIGTCRRWQERNNLPSYKPGHAERSKWGKKGVEARRRKKAKAKTEPASKAATKKTPPVAKAPTTSPLTATFVVRIDVDILGAPADVFRAMIPLRGIAKRGIAKVAIEAAADSPMAGPMLAHMRGEVT